MVNNVKGNTGNQVPKSNSAFFSTLYNQKLFFLHTRYANVCILFTI